MPSEMNRTQPPHHRRPRPRPNRAMLRAVGFHDDDFDRPMIGVAYLFSDITPCNAHLDRLARKGCEGVRAGGGVPQVFGAPTASDGIMMGHQGMRYSLVSREVIADSLEVVAGGMNHDGLLAFGGCDKNMPGCVMAMARLNIPSIFVYGGSILPGIGPDGEDMDIVSIFEAVGRQQAGKLDDKRVHKIECEACPGAGSCGGMYTANTMSSAIEAMGMSLPYDASQPAVSAAKERESFLAGQALVHLIEKNIRPRDIITRKSLENAYTMVLALGGSTNAVLHLMAIAREAGVEWTLADFDRLGDKVPHLADLKPGGRYVMNDLHRAGGTPAVLRGLLDAGMLHGDCITVTGRTLAENLKDVESIFKRKQDVVRPLNRPLHGTGHLVILHGNLAPDGAVAKVAGLTTTRITGPATRLRRRGGVFRGHPAARDQGRRRGGDPRRRAGRRPRHARNAVRDGGAVGQGLGEKHRPHHRRPLLRRHARPGGRPHRPGGVGGRPDRLPQGRRPRHHRRREEGGVGGVERGGMGEAQGGLEEAGDPGEGRRAGQVRPTVRSASEGAVTT